MSNLKNAFAEESDDYSPAVIMRTSVEEGTCVQILYILFLGVNIVNSRLSFEAPHPVEAEEAVAVVMAPNRVEAEEAVAAVVAPVVAPVAALEVVAQPWILALGEVDPALLARALGVKVPHRRQSQRLQNRSAHERAKSRRARMSLEKYFLEVIEAAAEMGKQGGDGGGGDGGDGSGDDGGVGSGDDGGDGGGDDGVLG
ncbi:uncharacterized protein LOC103871021 isoform X2 [Brassica rapa]|uniref:uncharacterized protein LOC103871021 isoform X2 n=1 Tax=Brassica campestris TaxID=3711 RepID=UPI00142D3470|nr:uncharacterized protein LOC103871021 isoform X2 [Brassica rapa]